jgi:hypothetical protein
MEGTETTDTTTTAATENVSHGTSEPDNTPKWWIDEKTPGVGDRPAWMQEKFKSVADVAAAYNNLEKKLGSTPKTDYEFGEYAEVFDTEHEAFKELKANLKERHVPQEAFKEMLQAVTKYHESFAPDAKAERAKLGENADKRIEMLTNWAQSNLSDNSFKALAKNLDTAETIMALEEIRNKMLSKGNIVPNGADNQNDKPTYTQEDIQSEINDNYEKYKTDTKYRNEMRAKMNAVAKDSSFVDKKQR